MSAIGLPIPHIGQHFDELGLCQCPCGDCTTRLAELCVCLECACDPDDPEAPHHGRLIDQDLFL